MKRYIALLKGLEQTRLSSDELEELIDLHDYAMAGIEQGWIEVTDRQWRELNDVRGGLVERNVDNGLQDHEKAILDDLETYTDELISKLVREYPRKPYK